MKDDIIFKVPEEEKLSDYLPKFLASDRGEIASRLPTGKDTRTQLAVLRFCRGAVDRLIERFEKRL